METRKAQLAGGSTFTVSLPKEWATKIDLGTGDTLQLFPRERTLIIEPAESNEYWETEVEIDHLSEAEVRRTIQTLYTTAFNRIRLSSSTDLSDNQRVISATARNLVGLETLESTNTQVTLQSLLDSATVSVEQSTVQIQQVALAMHEDAVRMLLEQDVDLDEHVAEQQNRVDRIYAMISRHFQRSLVSLRETDNLELDLSELYDYQTTARQLERVTDHAEKIANLATQFQTLPPNDFAEQIETNAEAARNIVEQAASTIIGDADIETAHKALNNRDKLTTELQEFKRELHNSDVSDRHVIALTLDSLTQTAECGGNIAEIALQTAARERRL